MSNARKNELDDAFFKMVYMDYEPLTKGEREGMRHFVSIAQPGYTTQCYNTVRDTLMPNALSEMESRWLRAYARHMDKQKRTQLSGCCGKFR